MLKALAEKKGLVGINFFPVFLSGDMEKAQTDLMAKVAAEHDLPADFGAIAKADPAKRETFDRDGPARWAKLKKTLPPVDVKPVVDHIDHIVKVTGTVDCVGLGSDCDGMSGRSLSQRKDAAARTTQEGVPPATARGANPSSAGRGRRPGSAFS